MRRVGSTSFALALTLGWAQPGAAADSVGCSPVPWAADSVRAVSPSGGTAGRTTDVIIAVKPPDQNVAATQIFSAQAEVAGRRIPLWLTTPVALDDAERRGLVLTVGERAWRFQVVGAPPQAVVTVFAAHYVYGATALERPVDCRMLVERVLVTYSTR